jgi:hypothetical protein
MRKYILIGLIFMSSRFYAQDICGMFIHTDRIKTGQSFVTRLILNSDSTFQYSFKGDLFNDNAEGKFSMTDNLIILNYKTPEYNIVTFKNDKTLNTSPPTTIQIDEQFRWTNPTAYLWPTELVLRHNKLIVLKTKDNNMKSKMKLERVIKIQ